MIKRNDFFATGSRTIALERQSGVDAAEKITGKEGNERPLAKPYERAQATNAHRDQVQKDISKFLEEQGIDGKESQATLNKAKGSMPITEMVGRRQDAASDALRKKVSPNTIDDLKAGYHCDLEFFQTGKASNTQIEGKRQTDAAVGMLVPIADLDSQTKERDISSAVDPGNLIVRVTPDVGIPYDLDLGSVRQWNWENGSARQAIITKVGQELAKRDSVTSLSVPTTVKEPDQDTQVPPRTDQTKVEPQSPSPAIPTSPQTEVRTSQQDLAARGQTNKESTTAPSNA